MNTRLLAAAAFVAALLSAAAPASADTTLGLAAPPGGASTATCQSSTAFIQQKDDPSTPYIVPAGGGIITQWQTDATGATAGSPLTFVVLRPTGTTSYKVVALDTHNLPTPAAGAAVFTLPAPVSVQQGDTFALYSSVSGSATCFWFNGLTPSADTINGMSPSPPVLNATESVFGSGQSSAVLNLTVDLVTRQDARVTTSAGPAHATAGHLALLKSTVTNGGPNTRSITFTDVVPTGLTINQATAGSGRCTVSGQKVTCTISNVAAGQSAPVLIVVTPKHAGRYTHTVSAALPANVPDPNTSNNTAKATLKVSPPPCVVPHLKGAPVSVAKEVLKLLGCRTKVKKVTAGGVSGTVLKTKPGPGTYAGGRKVMLTVVR